MDSVTLQLVRILANATANAAEEEWPKVREALALATELVRTAEERRK